MNQTFIRAVKKGDCNVLEKLWSEGFDLSQFQNWALDHSMKKGDMRTVDLLLSTPEVMNSIGYDVVVMLKMRM